MQGWGSSSKFQPFLDPVPHLSLGTAGPFRSPITAIQFPIQIPPTVEVMIHSRKMDGEKEFKKWCLNCPSSSKKQNTCMFSFCVPEHKKYVIHGVIHATGCGDGLDWNRSGFFALWGMAVLFHSWPGDQSWNSSWSSSSRGEELWGLPILEHWSSPSLLKWSKLHHLPNRWCHLVVSRVLNVPNFPNPHTPT